jgi:hypothetical protein
MSKIYHKTKFDTIALILTLTIATVLVALPITTAQDSLVIPTFLAVTVTPNPVGVNQIVYLHAVFSKPTPTQSGGGGDLHENVTIEMVTPDGSKEDLGTYRAGMTGAVSTSFTPNQVGEYTIKAVYPGQVLTGKDPDTGRTGQAQNMAGSRLMPAESEEVTLVVQEDQVTSIYQTPPLPNEYWTRPIYATNWDWGQLGANWFGMSGAGFSSTGGYDASGNVQAYGPAPNSAHIMWSKSTHFGGQPGSPIPSDQSTQYTSTSVLTSYFDPIVLNGIIYYTKYAGVTSKVIGWEAVDIRTGETLWSRSGGESGSETLRMGQILRFHNPQEYGSMAYLYGTTGGGFFGGGGDFSIYDAFTGEYVAEITGTTSASFLVDVDREQKGTILGYYSSGGNLVLWNSTKLFSSSAFGSYEMTRISGTYDWANGIEWSAPLPTELNGLRISLSVSAVTHEVILLRQVETLISWQEANAGYQITAGMNATTGELLWGPINQTLPALQDIAVVGAREGYYVLHNKDANEAYGYSLMTGENLWTVELEGNAWSSIWRDGEIAYGRVYIFDAGGYAHAIDLESGALVWNFTRGSAGYDTPFGTYPVQGYNAHSIADGKLFLSEGFLYTPPLHPSRRLAINCTDGSLVWSILSYTSRTPGAIADGHLVTWNSFDNRIYSFGKGPTKITVTAPDAGVPVGSSVVIRGTVMDISAGSKQEGVIERFPNGLPAVADECMREWMEHVYMQQSKPEDVEGVKVFLKILDPNGDWYSATVTTDRNGRFSHMWAPAIVGEYHVDAMFEGSESYYPSQETITFGVDQALDEIISAEEIAETTKSTLPAYPTCSEIAYATVNQMPDIPAYLTIDLGILVIAAIGVVIGLIAYMSLRKEK